MNIIEKLKKVVQHITLSKIILNPIYNKQIPQTYVFSIAGMFWKIVSFHLRNGLHPI